MGEYVKPTLPKGTRDFNTEQMAKRRFIIETIRSVYESYGYLPIETPAMENIETLTGKYGEEGDRLIFKILNSGDYLSKVEEGTLKAGNTAALTQQISKKALRYDLTVPFARFVVQNQNDLTFPFKRYQIQPVWRADRPQKGRYQEFYQCDADIIGSTSLLSDAELLVIIQKVFQQLQLPVKIRLNNRKILKGIANALNLGFKFQQFAISVDKLDKIGREKVEMELNEIGMDSVKFKELLSLMDATSYEVRLTTLEQFMDSDEEGMSGLRESMEVIDYLKLMGFNSSELEFDPLLARGLDYYTGSIIEAVANDSTIGSICGGGRYDNLTSIFGLENMSGIGISFGIDRIFDLLDEREAFPEMVKSSSDCLIINFGAKELHYLLPIAENLRAEGLKVVVYPEEVKLKKQFKFADSNRIKWALIAGEAEMEQNSLSVKNLITGEQHTVERDKIIEYLLA